MVPHINACVAAKAENISICNALTAIVLTFTNQARVSTKIGCFKNCSARVAVCVGSFRYLLAVPVCVIARESS
jgi:hypothetical protein